MDSELLEIMPTSIRGTFHRMEIAEEEITAAKARHQDGDKIDKEGFMLLCPRMDMTDVAYRSHCAELLDRLAWGSDTSQPTAAEVCMVLMDASLKAPLTPAATEVYRLHMIAAFPYVHRATLAEPYDGDYPGHIQEESDEIRRQIRKRMEAAR